MSTIVKCVIRNVDSSCSVNGAGGAHNVANVELLYNNTVSTDKELTIRNLKKNNEKSQNNWTTDKPHKVQSTVKFRGSNITTQASLHHLLDQQSGFF